MVKDDIIFRLTGARRGEVTTRGFTYFFDVPGQRYWHEMLDFCSIAPITACRYRRAGPDVGPVRDEVADRLPAAASYRVNAGALDHFCAMVGTGSYAYRCRERVVRHGPVLVDAGARLDLRCVQANFLSRRAASGRDHSLQRRRQRWSGPRLVPRTTRSAAWATRELEAALRSRSTTCTDIPALPHRREPARLLPAMPKGRSSSSTSATTASIWPTRSRKASPTCFAATWNTSRSHGISDTRSSRPEAGRPRRSGVSSRPTCAASRCSFRTSRKRPVAGPRRWRSSPHGAIDSLSGRSDAQPAGGHHVLAS